MDIEKWSELAWKYAKTSNKKGLSGVELDDLYQCAMLGMFLADKTYDASKGSFQTYAHWYIIKEIHNMIYKRSSDPRIREVEVEQEEELWYDEEEDETVWVASFLNTVPLREEYRQYLYNIMTFGSTIAVMMFVEETGLSRARAYQVKKEIREVAKKHYRRMEE